LLSREVERKLLVEALMRDVNIYTEKTQYIPGDHVSGYVVISTDNTFTCNRIVLKVRGQEYTHYQAGKVHVSETHEQIEDDITIWEGGEINSGDTKFEFSFKLSEDLPPNHDGTFGDIQYSIEAVVEIDRRLDPKSKITLNLGPQPPPFIPEPMTSEGIRQEIEHLVVEIPTDIVRPGRELPVRFLVRERSRIKGVRIDVIKREEASCQGRNLESSKQISERSIPITEIAIDRWCEETIHEDWSSILPFEGKLISSSIVLKVVLEVGLALDPSVEFPLRLSGEKKGDDELFDSMEIDLGW